MSMCVDFNYARVRSNCLCGGMRGPASHVHTDTHVTRVTAFREHFHARTPTDEHR